jgi:hypothetical protein
LCGSGDSDEQEKCSEDAHEIKDARKTRGTEIDDGNQLSSQAMGYEEKWQKVMDGKLSPSQEAALMTRCKVWIFALFATLCGSGHMARAQMVPVNSYSNLKYSPDYGECDGYELELWKMDGRLYGTLMYCAGLAGDNPIGYLDHVVWNAKTGELKFDAKLAGSFYHFNGRLTPTSVRGKLTQQEMADKQPTPRTEDVKLKPDKRWAEQMEKYPTCDEWQRSTAPAFRGQTDTQPCSRK